MQKHINYFDIPYQTRNEQLNTLTDMNAFYVANIALSNGSIEQSLYKPYYNYVPRTLIMNETKQGLISAIQAYYFSIVDLGLYLDVNPNDRRAIILYNNYVNKFKIAMDKYETLYGSKTLVSKETNDKNFDWLLSWPWEERD